MEANIQENQGNMRARVTRKVDDGLRRLMDIVLSLIGLVLLSPLFLIIAIAIKRSSPGPIFYWGPRAGRGGKTFNILKFRTMYERKESYAGPKVTAENDPRIMPLGRILRQTKLNELPQLWNVFIGDMSMVGPRPEDPSIAAEWPDIVRKEVLSVRPGITSPASVVYRNEEDLLQTSNLMDTYLWEILPSKMRLDQLYVRNRSVLTDLDVIFWTFVALIPRLKSFSVPEHLLYWGPLSQFTYHYLGWFLIDFIVSFLAISSAGILRRLTTPFDLGLNVAIGWALAIALMFSLINALAGLNRINWARARAHEAYDLAFSTAIVTALVVVANLVFPTGARFPISVILLSGVMSYIGFAAVRYRTRLLAGIATRWIHLRGQAITNLGERVLIVGAGEVARFAIWLLSTEDLNQAFSIVGLVDDNPRKVRTKLDGYTVINTTNAIPDMVQKHDIGLILFAIADINPEEQDRILELCQSTSARIVPIPDIIDNIKAQFPMDEIDREVHFNKVLDNVTVDKLTGAYNRQHFIRLAEVELNRAQRYDRPLALVAVSIDYLRPKKISYVRQVTSQVMRAAARRSLESIRGIDILSRYEDNVFIVLLPETDEAAAQVVAQRIKQHITAEPVHTSRGPVVPIVEVSLTTSTRDDEQIEDLVHRAYDPIDQSQRKGEAIVFGETKLK